MSRALHRRVRRIESAAGVGRVCRECGGKGMPGSRVTVWGRPEGPIEGGCPLCKRVNHLKSIYLHRESDDPVPPLPEPTP